MKHIQNTSLIAPFVALLPCLCTHAQTSMTGFFPEADLYVRPTSDVRLVLQAKGYIEAGDFRRAELGPSFQFNSRPSEKLRNITVFDMDDKNNTGQPPNRQLNIAGLIISLYFPPKRR